MKKQAFALSPFDLNVLCTPPAFILSQDQTLHKMKMSWQMIIIADLSFALITFLCWVNKLWELSCISSVYWREFTLDTFVSRLSFSAVQFSKTMTRRLPRLPPSLWDSFNIIPHFTHFVNTFFQKKCTYYRHFFNIFGSIMHNVWKISPKRSLFDLYFTRYSLF